MKVVLEEDPTDISGTGATVILDNPLSPLEPGDMIIDKRYKGEKVRVVTYG